MIKPPIKSEKPQKGLKYKLMIAFTAMSVIPLLACTYLISSYIFPKTQNLAEVSLVLLISIGMSVLGLSLAKTIIDRVAGVTSQTKMIAGGEFGKKIDVNGDDEIGNLGESINFMTDRMRSNFDELKAYSQKTREINQEIHKKVLSLSSLLQIGDTIAGRSAQLDVILDMSVHKVATIFDTGFAALYLPRVKGGDVIAKAYYNVDNETLLRAVFKQNGQGLFEKAMSERSVLIIDEGAYESKPIAALKAEYGLKNLLAVPLFSGSDDLGLFMVGHNLDYFKFKMDDIDLVKVFAKQVTIAIENDALVKRGEDLAIIDELTGLLNKGYMMIRLEEEIKRSIYYRRPCSFILFNMDNFSAFLESKGELAAEDVLRKAAKIIKEYATPMEKIARIGGDEFAVLLPERNKVAAASIAEEIRKRIQAYNFAKEGVLSFTVSAGISENPIDGSTKEELYKKAHDALHDAKILGKNRVLA